MALPGYLGNRRNIAIGLIVLFLAAFGVETRAGAGTVHVTAYFPATVGVYEGSEVRLMGVPIGKVTTIEPEGERVRMELEYDGDYDVPADAKAVIISPSVISDRFVQLTPGYDGEGAVLPDGAVIDEQRTEVPVELDEAFSVTNDLLTALGPRGANDEGALNRLLAVGADTLRGNGDELRGTVAGLAGLSETLGDTSGEFFATVRHMRRFTASLAANDDDVRRFNRKMADIAGFLSSERDELSATLTTLADTFGLVEGFVRDNRDLLVANVDHLSRIASALAAERDALTGVLKVLPVAGSNMARAWDPDTQSIRARNNGGELLKDIGGLLCDSLQNIGVPQPDQACDRLEQLLLGALG